MNTAALILHPIFTAQVKHLKLFPCTQKTYFLQMFSSNYPCQGALLLNHDNLCTWQVWSIKMPTEQHDYLTGGSKHVEEVTSFEAVCSLWWQIDRNKEKCLWLWTETLRTLTSIHEKREQKQNVSVTFSLSETAHIAKETKKIVVHELTD